MEISYDKFSRAEAPELTLCNPYCIYDARTGRLSNPVAQLAAARDIELCLNFNQLSELNFVIDKQTAGGSFAATQNRRLVFAEGFGFFIINSVETTESDEGVSKSVGALSCDADLMRKLVPYYDTETVNSLEYYLDIVRREFPEWHFPTGSEIPEAIAAKERIMPDTSDDENVYAFLFGDLQKAFNCVFEVDYITRTISCYDADTYVGQPTAFIPADGLADSISVARTSNDVRTALTVYGENDIGISMVNPIGGNTVYDFSYFYDQMQPALADKVTQWQDDIGNAEAEYIAASAAWAQASTNIVNCEADITRLDTLKHVYEMLAENLVAGESSQLASADTIESYDATIEDLGGEGVDPDTPAEQLNVVIQTQLDSIASQKTAAVAALESYTNAAQQQLEIRQAVVDRLALENYFTPKENEELRSFTIQAYWNYEYSTQTDSMTDGDRLLQAVALYDAAKTQLANVSDPPVEISGEMKAFPFYADYRQLARKLVVGRERIDVEFRSGGIYSLLLTSITLNYEDRSLSLTFADRIYRDDNRSLYESLFGEVSRTSNAVSREKTAIYPVTGDRLSTLRSAASTALDITKEQAITATDNSVVIDSTGYLGRRMQSTGAMGEQIKIVNNSIVFTDDGWDTAQLAIGPIETKNGSTVFGVNAGVVIGRLLAGSAIRIAEGEESETLGEIIGDMRSILKDVSEAVGYWLTFDPDKGLIIGQNATGADGTAFYSQQKGSLYALFSTISNNPIVSINSTTVTMTGRRLHTRKRLSIGDCDIICSKGGVGIKW